MHQSRVNFRFLILVFVSVLLINVDAHTRAVAPLRALLGMVVLPLHELVLIPERFSNWISSRAISTPELREELTQSRQVILELKARQQLLESVEAENLRLRQLLSSSRKGLDRVMLAELVDVSLEPFTQSVLINRGLVDEIYEGQPVLDAFGVVGQVTRTSYLRSAVSLVTDPGQTIPVLNERNGLRAVTRGSGSERGLEVPFLDRNSDIRKGDLLLASGMGGRFPHGYPVAVVRGVTVDVNEPFLRIVAEPIAKLGYSREVLLVWPGEFPPIRTPETVNPEETPTEGAPTEGIEDATGQ